MAESMPRHLPIAQPAYLRSETFPRKTLIFVDMMWISRIKSLLSRVESLN